jgi:hypothetical protein
LGAVFWKNWITKQSLFFISNIVIAYFSQALGRRVRSNRWYYTCE